MHRPGKLTSGLLPCLCVFVAASGVQASETAKPDLSEWINQRFADHFASQDQVIEVVDDATFLRRAYLDLTGRIPTIAELRDFMADESADKRAIVVDKLMDTERFNVHTSRVWRRMLMPPGTTANPQFASALDTWLQQQLKNETGYDEVARRLVIAGGADTANAEEIDSEIESRELRQRYSTMLTSSPTAFLQQTGGQPANMASSITRVFLGVRLECAQCHDHPFTNWKQGDFWGVAAFFAGAQITPRFEQRQADATATAQSPKDTHTTSITDEDGKSYTVGLPWDGDGTIVSIPDDELPRQYFAQWMTSPENPHFAATAVNRIWQQLCGKGLTSSVDDLDQATEEERRVVLDDLASRFADQGFNVKGLIRAICVSDYYQRSSEKQESSSTVIPRPLTVMTPEQLFDSYELAMALPISSIDQGPRFNGEREALVSRMEEAMGERPDDFRSGIPQALTLMNGRTTAHATDLKKSRTLRAVIDAPFLDTDEKVETLFLATLSRAPHEFERTKLLEFIQQSRSQPEAFSEIMWALINSPEFVLVR